MGGRPGGLGGLSITLVFGGIGGLLGLLGPPTLSGI